MLWKFETFSPSLSLFFSSKAYFFLLAMTLSQQSNENKGHFKLSFPGFSWRIHICCQSWLSKTCVPSPNIVSSGVSYYQLCFFVSLRAEQLILSFTGGNLPIYLKSDLLSQFCLLQISLVNRLILNFVLMYQELCFCFTSLIFNILC